LKSYWSLSILKPLFQSTTEGKNLPILKPRKLWTRPFGPFLFSYQSKEHSYPLQMSTPPLSNLMMIHLKGETMIQLDKDTLLKPFRARLDGCISICNSLLKGVAFIVVIKVSVT
jgi:hypothetical protein